MGSEQEDQTGPRLPREVDQQCRMRDANEVVERLKSALIACAEQLAFRCECGDPDCQARLSLTRTEYERVRAYGSHFAVNVDHENPENACVLSENARYAVIDVVGGDDRYQVRAQNPRHDWVEARDGRT